MLSYIDPYSDQENWSLPLSRSCTHYHGQPCYTVMLHVLGALSGLLSGLSSLVGGAGGGAGGASSLLSGITGLLGGGGAGNHHTNN